MSRIAGIIEPAATCDTARSTVRRMLGDALPARLEAVPGGCLGWTGIVRPAAGPGAAATPRCVVVLDGCLYDLPRLGGADGEGAAALIARLYEQRGLEHVLDSLNGEYALAIADLRDGSVHLVRDRLGCKPLYYVTTPGRVAFASQTRALRALPGIGSAINRRFVAIIAAGHYRAIDNEPGESPYAAIAQLSAAHRLTLRAGRGRPEPYWSLHDGDDLAEPPAALAERYRDLLLDAVEIRRRRADRPVFTLSGGMDSSSVLACAVHATGQRQVACSTVYDDATFDESAQIRTILDDTVEQWHPVAIGDRIDLDDVAAMVRAHDEPVATATWYAHAVMCREMASRGHGSLFGGLGGDELNAGEFEHFWYHFADLQAAGRGAELDEEVRCWSALHDHPIHRKSPAIAAEGIGRLADLEAPGRCRPDERRLLRYASALDPAFFDLPAWRPVMEHPFRSYLKNRTYQDLTRETMPCCLRAQDRQATAAGLECHTPFLDHRLVEFMFKVPGALKIRRGVTKILLREAMRGILPEATRTRVAKTGWNAPAHRWFAGDGRRAVLDLVGSRSFRERGIYHLPRVHELIDEHERIVLGAEVRENHMMFLWQLVNLELWLRLLDDEG